MVLVAEDVTYRMKPLVPLTSASFGKMNRHVSHSSGRDTGRTMEDSLEIEGRSRPRNPTIPWWCPSVRNTARRFWSWIVP